MKGRKVLCYQKFPEHKLTKTPFKATIENETGYYWLLSTKRGGPLLKANKGACTIIKESQAGFATDVAKDEAEAARYTSKMAASKRNARKSQTSTDAAGSELPRNGENEKSSRSVRRTKTSRWSSRTRRSTEKSA